MLVLLVLLQIMAMMRSIFLPLKVPDAGDVAAALATVAASVARAAR